jgi:hypothetical protein
MLSSGNFCRAVVGQPGNFCLAHALRGPNFRPMAVASRLQNRPCKTAGNAANSASAFQALLAHMEHGAGAASSTTGTTSASIDPVDTLGNLTLAGVNGVEQVLGNAIQQALQAYGVSSASSALPPLSI